MVPTPGINPLPPPLPALVVPTTATNVQPTARQGRIVLSPKRVRELVTVPVDFAGVLGNEAIVQAGVEMTVHSGTDYYPGQMVSIPPLVAGTVLHQPISGGVEGCIYRLALFVKSTTAQILELTGYLAVIPELIERRSVPEFVQWLNGAGATVQWQNATPVPVYWRT